MTRLLDKMNQKIKKLPKKYPSIKPIIIISIIIIIYGWALTGIKADIAQIKDSLPYMIDFITRLFPPNLTVIDLAIKALIETVQMSIWGTTIGALLSIPIAILSAHNISPKWAQLIANFIQNAIRSIPSIVLGLFFVSATGLGAPAGTLALGIYTIGYLGKFYQEAIESVDESGLESLRILGANWIQITQYGILPQVLPISLGYTLYMFEYNIRAASVLGVVGAGGIGFELVNYIKGFEYNKATTMMLVLLVVVTIIDFISSKLRKKIEEN